MRISLEWLAELVTLPEPEVLRRRLTGAGLEVEAVERAGAGLEGVVAARILGAEAHPRAGELRVTTVETGAGEALQVVCGATNWRVGDVVALAPAGARLPGGTEIRHARIRGVESAGMLCSPKELGLSEDGSGLLVLPAAVAPGTPVSRALGLEDVVFEVNVTPNRPDCLSHLGIAREVAALFGKKLHRPPSRLAERGGSARAAVRVRIEAPERCARYAARVVEGVRVGPSPAWLARRLESCGIRSISNVVDATNLALLELGHPLHAFDLDRVAGSEIVVRTAGPGERLTTLDGQERSLDPDDLVIADRDRASALAGVMGGGDSEISAGTTRILVESAWFEPGGIRRTARRHGLHTEASHRFERGADPGMVIPSLDRCAALVAELAGGEVRRGAVDCHPRRVRAPKVRLAWSRPAELLGAPVSRGEARRLLESLGFAAARSDARGAVFQVPSWRPDVRLEEDLVEEIARLRGYDSIPETLPPIASRMPSVPREAQALSRLREALEAAGFSEAVNFSFVAPADLEPLGEGGGAIALRNPISAEMAVMRTSLVPSLLRNVAFNRRHRVEDVRLYEVASVYRSRPPGSPADVPAREEARLACVALGRRSPRGWAVGDDPFDFADLKAVLEGLLESLGLGPAELRVGGPPWLHPTSACAVELALEGGARQRLGVAGEVHPRVAGAFELPPGVQALDLSLDALLAEARLAPAFRGVPRFPALLRDLAVVVAEDVAARRVMEVARDEPLVEEVTLFDVYRGAPVPAGHKNLAMSIRYRSRERTLTDGEADAAHARIVERLRADPAIRAELRG